MTNKNDMNKFQPMSKIEAMEIKGGWKLFGRESKHLRNTTDANGNCVGVYHTRRYFFGFSGGGNETYGGCN